MVELSGEGAIEVLQALGEIPDPEIPVISLVELGVVRRIDCSQGRVRVELTPTYSGCPAMHLMEQQVHDKLADLGYSEIEVRKVYSPAWSTDWIDSDAKEKLRNYGIAPPGPKSLEADLVVFPKESIVQCPYCSSNKTELRSQFGSTSCKSTYFCKQCIQPFELFKPI